MRAGKEEKRLSEVGPTDYTELFDMRCVFGWATTE